MDDFEAQNEHNQLSQKNTQMQVMGIRMQMSFQRNQRKQLCFWIVIHLLKYNAHTKIQVCGVIQKEYKVWR